MEAPLNSEPWGFISEPLALGMKYLKSQICALLCSCTMFLSSVKVHAKTTTTKGVLEEQDVRDGSHRIEITSNICS